MPPAASASSKAYCYCSNCGGNERRSLRTIRGHLKDDERELLKLSYISNTQASTALAKELTRCITKTVQQLKQAEILSNVITKPAKSYDICHTKASECYQQDLSDNEVVKIQLIEENMEEIIESENFLQYKETRDDSEVNWEDELPSDEETCIIRSPSIADAELDEEIIPSGTSQNTTIPSLTVSNPTNEPFKESIYYKNISQPEPLLQLREKLLNNYKCPKTKPSEDPKPRELTDSEELSIQHYIVWWKTNGTIDAYNQHATLLENTTGTPVLSLYRVRHLAEKLLDFQPKMVDMCIRSCMAYTGEFQSSHNCEYIHKQRKCNKARYKITKGKQIAQMQFLVMPVMVMIKALFSNTETANAIRYRDSTLKAALNLVAGMKSYSDFPNGEVHRTHYSQMNLFQDSRDIAFAISSDGAQLTMKRQSSTWVLILILLNLPPEIRYKSNNTIIALVIPGPNTPGNIESYIYPLFQEMAMASEGLWVWDAVDSSYFILRASVVMVLGDMLGSAKLSGMAGHTANYGDRFTMVRSAKSGDSNSQAVYYPIFPPSGVLYNSDRPSYTFSQLPYRKETDYWNVILQLHAATTKTARAAITKETGISRLPLCAASLAFRHPSFFPFDPFHLFYENCMAYIWDLWTKYCNPEELMHMPAALVKRLGEYIDTAIYTLPPVFCGPIRNPYLKRQSQYKIYEWMGLLHWYLVPICLELGFNYTTLENFSNFVYIIEYAMTIERRTDTDLQELYQKISNFLEEFEQLYIGDNPLKISRARLCIFQLIHIPNHIKWNGSVRVSSQATVERTIGELGHRIRSLKAPFANLTNLMKEKAVIGMLTLHYPNLSFEKHGPQNSTIQLFSQQNFTKTEKLFGHPDNINWQKHFDTLTKSFGQNTLAALERFGKLRLKNQHVLRTALVELPEIEGSTKRYYRWFKGVTKGVLVFGEALAFYKFATENSVKEVVVYRPLTQLVRKLNVALMGRWGAEYQVLDISDIISIVGIWRVPNSDRVYILQKHPGLEMLSFEEIGIEGDHAYEEI